MHVGCLTAVLYRDPNFSFFQLQKWRRNTRFDYVSGPVEDFWSCIFLGIGCHDGCGYTRER